MALIDFEQLTQPVAADAPCGPDLDLDGDADYMNLMARIEGLLPETFFSFDRASIDFKAEMDALSRLLGQTRDLRVLAFLAKLLVLDRNLGDFARCVSAMADLLATRWSEVHPGVAEADSGMRSAVLQTLDDLPNVIFPLQYMPLAHSRRAGAITYRSQMIVAGEVARRDQDPVQDATALDQALAEGDLPALVATRDDAARLAAAVARIKATWIENAGFEDTPSLDRLAHLSEKITAFLDQAVARRDPAAALKGAGGADGDDAAADADADAAAVQPAPGGLAFVRTTREAAAVLAGVARFLSRSEPSNPALLLVKQAEQLVGKTFVEIMTILVPDAIGDARINVGNDQPVAFPIERLSALMEAADEDAAEPGGDDDDDAEAEAGEEDAAPAAPTPRSDAVVIASRTDAMARLDQVASFYRSAEPSSPIPLLMERARSFASRDFMSLLREIAPERR